MSNTTPSPKLIRLDAEIKAEADPIKRGCLRGERAGLLARQGSFDLARDALNSLRRDFSFSPDASVSIWMQISEGWMAHYSGEPTAARDRMRRAYALSIFVGNNDLVALSAAWLAHFAYSEDSFVEMINYLKVSKNIAKDSDHTTQTRLCLVIAQCFHFANRLDLAIPWYVKARKHALTDSDDAALSVLNYNMAGRRAFYLVADSIFRTPETSDSKLAGTGIKSSQNFDQIFDILVLSAWIHVLQAMADSADLNFTNAIHLYEMHLDKAMKTGLGHQIAFFKADLAWCFANVGNVDKAAFLAQESFLLADDKMYVEDRALTFGRLGQVYSLINNDELSKFCKRLGIESNNKLQTMRDELLTLLSRIEVC